MTTLAMHASDGLLSAPASLLFGAVAVLGLAVAAVGARRDLDDRVAPMAGLVAAFVFATQMINFPVLPGVSGHLLGGALAAILVGPWVGALTVSVVVVLQALLFADGGLTALGANLVNMALLATIAGYLVALAMRRLVRRSRYWLVATTFLAAMVGTVAAAAGFVMEYAVGGQGAVSMTGFATALLGVHLLIGIGEGVITALTVGAVVATRPDLVYAFRTRTVGTEVTA